MQRSRYTLRLGCEQPAGRINHGHGGAAPMRVLVCTDAPNAARCQTDLLHRGGLWPDVATTAKHAILRLASGLYAAVTIDAAMMDGGGVEIIQAMGRSTSLRHVPVLVIATVGEGADGCVVGALCLADWITGRDAATRLLDTLRGPSPEAV